MRVPMIMILGAHLGNRNYYYAAATTTTNNQWKRHNTSTNNTNDNRNPMNNQSIPFWRKEDDSIHLITII